MNFDRFFKVLNRYKWYLIFIPIATVCLTSYLVQDLPEEYTSKALISTGLVDPSQQISVGNNNLDYYTVNQQFENILSFLQLKKNISILSFKLMIHDIENPENSFSNINETLSSLDSSKRVEVVNAYKRLLSSESIITPEDNGVYPLFDYIKESGYDEKSLLKNLNISRQGGSDYVEVEFTSLDPYLSVFIVNTMSRDFINKYKERYDSNQHNSKELLDSLLKNKEASMEAKNAQVQSFQVQNSVINLASQAQVVFAQITEKETERATTVGDIQSLQAAIVGIESKLKNRNSNLISTNIDENNQIVSIKNQLQKANERYVDGGFKPSDAQLIDSLQARLTLLIASTVTNTASDPKLLRQNLTQQKLDMEVDLDRAKSRLTVIMKDLGSLKQQYNRMVPNDAGMKNYEREAEVATKEYLSALDMFNQNSMIATTGINPQLVQPGVVGPPESSKKILYILLSGVGSLSTCFLFLIGSSLLDKKIRSTDDLSLVTKSKVIGQINNIVPNDTDLRTVWESGESTNDYKLYKDLTRALRFEIDNALKKDDDRILGITALCDNAGTSFISSSLAYSFAMTHRRVLLIGGDFKLETSRTPKELPESQLFDSFVAKREIRADDFITKLTTNPNNESLLEIYNEEILKKSFDELRKEFDLIIIDIQSLQRIHRSKEWLMFVDKSIAVIPAGVKINNYEQQLISMMNDQRKFMGWVLNKTKKSDMGSLKMIHSN